MHTTDEEYAAHPLKDIQPTHRAPSFTVNPHNGDKYSAYNKPAAVIDWLKRVQVTPCAYSMQLRKS